MIYYKFNVIFIIKVKVIVVCSTALLSVCLKNLNGLIKQRLPVGGYISG